MRKHPPDIFFSSMRLTTILIALLAFFILVPVASAGLNTSGNETWTWAHPDPQGAPINSIDFVDANTGYGVTTAGHLVKTTNGGTDWSALLPVDPPSCNGMAGSGCQMFGVDFLDANTGWAVGGDGTILKTTDGGSTWVAESLPAGYGSEYLYEVAFFDANNGVVVGENYAFYTSDGGSVWTRSNGISSKTLRDVRAVNSTTAFAVGNNGFNANVYKTTNMGVTWSPIQNATIQDLKLYAAEFTDASNGIVVGCNNDCSAGAIARTTDGGANWVMDDSTITEPLYGMEITGSILVAVGDNGTILRTAAGSIWSDGISTVAGNLQSGAVSSGTTSRLLDVVFPGGSTTGYAAGKAGAVVKTTDNGSNWGMVAGSDDVHLKGASFLDAATGWVAGDSGTVLKTADGGQSWADDATGIPSDMTLLGIQFLDASTGFAAGCQGAGCESNGTEGRVYIQSGGTWSAANIPAGTKALRAIHMTDATHGWAVGNGGEAIRTTNGTDWAQAATGLTADISFNSIDAIGNDVWAVGQDVSQGVPGSGAIFKYNNDLNTWEETIPASPPGFLTAIDMVDANVGYTVGGSDKLYKTVNGGASWTLLSTGLSSGSFIPPLQTGISFVNQYVGYVAASGMVAYTIDGGTNWTAESVGTYSTASLDAIQTFVNDEQRVTYAVGRDAAVFKGALNISDPFGTLDAASGSTNGKIDVSGWAIDHNAGTNPIDVHVYVNGQYSGQFTADGSRPDVAAIYPTYGENHGFSGQVDAVATSNTVCAYGINTGPGGNILLGCQEVDVQVDPFGNLDGISAGDNGKINVGGWAIDPNAGTDPIDVHFFVNDVDKGSLTADANRPDIGAAFPAYGENHGFSGQIDAVATSNTVCAYGINTGPGSDVLLGCKTVNVPGGNPFGSLDGVSAGNNGKINVGGWAIDPNAGIGSIDVHFYVNGVYRGPLTANANRPDIGAAFPAYGENHGFSGQIDAVATSNTVCAYGINTGPGGNVLLGCKSVNVQVNPFGNLDGVSVDDTTGKINVGGWAIDPNAGTGSIDVHFYVNGVYKGPLTANANRPDIGAAFPAYGENHGFSGQVNNAGTGNNTVCAYGINTGAGGNVLLGCKTVNVPSGNPFGSLDGVSAGNNGKINVGGWAIDPNAGIGSIDVHFYVNGVYKGPLTADQSRPDLAPFFPGYGTDHGFSGQIDAVATSNTVCAYGINTGPGGNVLLGCKSVNVQVNPFGNLDSISDNGSEQIKVSGWAIDPNAGTGSIEVHFYVNGVYKGPLTANANRPDIGAAFPAYGGDHAFDGIVAAQNPGANNTVCAYGINTGPGGNVLLGCRVAFIADNP